jgi:hypothetical protein
MLASGAHDIHLTPPPSITNRDDIMDNIRSNNRANTRGNTRDNRSNRKVYAKQNNFPRIKQARGPKRR